MYNYFKFGSIFDFFKLINQEKFDANQIPKEWNSVEFNFDGSAVSQLQPASIYQWRIYSDDDAAAGVQTLLSASEDLMGLFKTP